MPVTAATQRILDRALGGERMTRDEALTLMDLDLNSVDCYALMAANEFSHRQAGGRGTVYSQVGINVWPCPENCNFCYLATKHKIVTTLHELSVEEIVARALDFERSGADEVYLMTTANYPVERFLEIGREVRRALSKARRGVEDGSVGAVGPGGEAVTRDAGGAEGVVVRPDRAELAGEGGGGERSVGRVRGSRPLPPIAEAPRVVVRMCGPAGVPISPNTIVRWPRLREARAPDRPAEYRWWHGTAL